MAFEIRAHEIRAYLYRLLGAAGPLLGVTGAATEEEIYLYLGLGAAILGNGIAVINTSNVRQWIYGIILAVAAIAVYFNIVTEMESELWVNFLVTMIGGAGNISATVNSTTNREPYVFDEAA